MFFLFSFVIHTLTSDSKIDSSKKRYNLANGSFRLAGNAIFVEHCFIDCIKAKSDGTIIQINKNSASAEIVSVEISKLKQGLTELSHLYEQTEAKLQIQQKKSKKICDDKYTVKMYGYLREAKNEKKLAENKAKRTEKKYEKTKKYRDKAEFTYLRIEKFYENDKIDKKNSFCQKKSLEILGKKQREQKR